MQPMPVRWLTWVLALVFAASGAAKLMSLPFELEAFMRWGYPASFMYAIGALEFAGAIGLLVPRLSALAALCLAGLMLGAIATHARHAEWSMLAVALALASLCAGCAWWKRQDLRALVPGRRG